MYKAKSTTIFRILILTVLSIMYAGNVQAQVSIAPTSVFLDERLPFANLLVSNGSDTPQEVSVSFRFGYSENDEEGNVVINYDTTGHERSLTENLNAFPRNFLLQPGQRQTVRIAATGIGDRQDGTYWTRVSVLASPESPPVESIEEGAVAARININFEQVIPLFYRKGDVSTGIEVNNVRFEKEEDSGHFLFDLHRTGNSPFLGSLSLRVLDSEGNQFFEESSNVTAYFDIIRRVTIDTSELEAGEYTAEYTFRSQRRDISSANMIQADPVQQAISFTIE